MKIEFDKSWNLVCYGEGGIDLTQGCFFAKDIPARRKATGGKVQKYTGGLPAAQLTCRSFNKNQHSVHKAPKFNWRHLQQSKENQSAAKR